jgi:23S rRNA (uridine2552-2'-O)-methyltransferase
MTKKTDTSSRRMMSVRVKTAKRRKNSSVQWLKRQLNDPYVIKAKEEGYRSRAAYKLKELNDSIHFLKKKCRVVDLGATPGGWTQVVLEEVDTAYPMTQVIALDINPMEPLSNSVFIEMDFTLEDAPEKLLEQLTGPVDVVLSDMAPPSCGHKQTDHLRIIGLVEMALDFALKVLAPGGTFVAKVWQGGSDKEMLALLKKNFTKVKHIKPSASRKESAETYVVAQGFKSESDD